MIFKNKRQRKTKKRLTENICPSQVDRQTNDWIDAVNAGTVEKSMVWKQQEKRKINNLQANNPNACHAETYLEGLQEEKQKTETR